MQSNPSLDIAPWFTPDKDNEEEVVTTASSSLRSKGTAQHRRKAKEKEREKELDRLKKEGELLVQEEELAGVASAVVLQSFVRGSLSRGNSREGSRPTSTK